MSMDSARALLAHGPPAALHQHVHGEDMLTLHVLASCRRRSWRATPTWRRSTTLFRTAVRARSIPALFLSM